MPRSAIVITIIVLLMLVVYFAISRLINQKEIDTFPQETNVQTNSPLHTVHSDKLTIEIKIPNRFAIEENQAVIDLLYNNEKISITKNNTNFDNLNDYIKDYDSKRSSKVISSSQAKIDDFQWTIRTINFPVESIRQKSYFLYVDNSVYILSTQFESLYPDLDQIAQSFRYIP